MSALKQPKMSPVKLHTVAFPKLPKAFPECKRTVGRAQFSTTSVEHSLVIPPPNLFKHLM